MRPLLFFYFPQHGIHQAGIHVHVGAHGHVRPRLVLDHGDAQLLDLLQQLEVLVIALDLRHVPGVLLQQHRPGVGDGVHRVAQAVDLPGLVPRLLVEDLVSIINGYCNL